MPRERSDKTDANHHTTCHTLPRKVSSEVKKDEELQQLISVMKAGWPKSKQDCPETVQPFWDSRHDLAVVQNILVKGNRVVIPKSMQKDVFHKLHSTHQGMDRMKRRARQSCYWPRMTIQIETMVKKCNECLR